MPERRIAMRASFIHRFLLFLCVCALSYLSLPPDAARAAGSTATPLPAASFDCAKAPGVDETVICSDPLLRKADHDLGQAYLATRAGNPDPAYRASLRTDERSWILQRNAECHLTKYTIVTDANRPALIDCFLDEYAERLADLTEMQRQKAAAPNSISHPIRHSFLEGGENNGAVPDSLEFSSLQLPPGSTGMPRLAWRAHGGLLILLPDAAGDGMIYLWSQGHLQPFVKVPQAARFNQICALDDGTIAVLPADGQTAGWIGTDKKFREILRAALPAAAAQDCGADGSGLHAGDGQGDVLNFGPRLLGITPVPRFVVLHSPAGDTVISPPIRIDSRFHLTATYLPFAGAFLVQSDVSPADLEQAVERRWAKSDCLAYWEVSAKTATAAPG